MLRVEGHEEWPRELEPLTSASEDMRRRGRGTEESHQVKKAPTGMRSGGAFAGEGCEGRGT